MPTETAQAIQWALQQEDVVVEGQVDLHSLVDSVRAYFNDHQISYQTFSAGDLEPYLTD